MREVYEIRIHGRAGQGAKSAAHFIAEAAFNEGKYVQAFPSYGPVRMGAPMNAFVRIGNEPIRVHSDIYEADAVLVIDPTLMEYENITDGLKPEGVLIINSPVSASDWRQKLGINQRVITVPASQISQEIFGKDLPNTAIIAVAASAAGFVEVDTLAEGIKKFFSNKYNPKVGEQNVGAMNAAISKMNNYG